MNLLNRRSFLKTVGAAAFFTVRSRIGFAQPNHERPNVVFFLIDDLGWRDLGCYGSTFYETPHIDRLAAEGMRFTNAYAACPVCSPTRASIMTGKYPARLNITDWIPGMQASRGPRPHQRLIGPKILNELPLEEVTLAEALKEAGYVTGFVGKWHLGGRDYLPENQGFDVNVAGNAKGSPPTYFYPYKRGNYALNLPGGQQGEYLTDRLTDEAVKFIDSHRQKPFFLFFSHYAVHTPLQSKPELTGKYKKKAAALPPDNNLLLVAERQSKTRQKQNHPVYAGMVQSTDESVGRIMQQLRRLGLEKNTIVIFMSDNGGLSTLPREAPTSNLPLRAGKGWCYEGGIREPMIVKWPEATPPGSACAEPVTSTDFYPTILNMLNLPLRPHQHLDGLSLVPLLKQSGSLDRPALYWHFPHYHGSGHTPSGAIRAGRYKLIEFYDENTVELYDLADDLGETRNLAALKPKKTADLLEMFHAWRRNVGARMPKPNPNYNPALKPGSKKKK